MSFKATPSIPMPDLEPPVLLKKEVSFFREHFIDDPAHEYLRPSSRWMKLIPLCRPEPILLPQWTESTESGIYCGGRTWINNPDFERSSHTVDTSFCLSLPIEPHSEPVLNCYTEEHGWFSTPIENKLHSGQPYRRKHIP